MNLVITPNILPNSTNTMRGAITITTMVRITTHLPLTGTGPTHTSILPFRLDIILRRRLIHTKAITITTLANNHHPTLTIVGRQEVLKEGCLPSGTHSRC